MNFTGEIYFNFYVIFILLIFFYKYRTPFALYVVHPDDIETREKKLKAEISELKLQIEELLAKNMKMTVDISEVIYFITVHIWAEPVCRL